MLLSEGQVRLQMSEGLMPQWDSAPLDMNVSTLSRMGLSAARRIPLLFRRIFLEVLCLKAFCVFFVVITNLNLFFDFASIFLTPTSFTLSQHNIQCVRLACKNHERLLHVHAKIFLL